MIRRTLAIGTLTVGLLVAGTGVAAAHECYIPNRSEKGNAGADHSANWSTYHLADLFAEAHMFLGGVALTEAQVAEATAMAAERGIPTHVTVFERKLLPASIREGDEPTAKSSDGKGIDHFFSTYIGQLAEIYFSFQEDTGE